MEKILVVAQFDDLTEEVQWKLYRKEKEKYEKEVAKSQYPDIRRLLIKDEKTSSDTLDEIFKVETEIYGDFQNIELLWYHPNFQRNDTKRKVLATSEHCELREIVAKDEESSSEFLNEMLRNEVQGQQSDNVIRAILHNLKLRMEEDTLKVLAASDNWELRKRAAEDKEISSELLNEMFRNEIAGERDNDVENAILNNLKFKMEQDTLKELGISDCAYYRLMAANNKEASAEDLQEWYLTETDKDVLEAIEFNLLQKISKTSVTTLNAIQKRQILNVLKELKHSKIQKPITKYLERIINIIG